MKVKLHIKFSETILSEMIQIGILFTFLKSQNMKNILIYLKANFVLIYFFFKITSNKLKSLRLIYF